mmetsp:Transcript_39511/g.44154  ORF Transcript_39511/g.44154 Transcript_39511/m.44154 type:complete len:168 (+) Transcript_39511:1398-1901(+)
MRSEAVYRGSNKTGRRRRSHVTTLEPRFKPLPPSYSLTRNQSMKVCFSVSDTISSLCLYRHSIGFLEKGQLFLCFRSIQTIIDILDVRRVVRFQLVDAILIDHGVCCTVVPLSSFSLSLSLSFDTAPGGGNSWWLSSWKIWILLVLVLFLLSRHPHFLFYSLGARGW